MVSDKPGTVQYDAYKDSGVEWLGQLPENWDLLPNKHIFKLKKNLVGKRSKEYELLSLTLNGVIKRDMENPEGKFPAEFDTYQEVKSGDFIFCHFDVEETPRTVGLSRFDGMITGAYTVYKVNAEKFCPEFLYYFYLNLDTGKRLKPLYKGLRNTIGKDIFGEFKTFIPNYSEQVKISNFLDQKVTEIDQAIAIKKQQIALLNERKQIVIQKAVTQGLDPNVAMKDSGVEWIGEIPEHWKIKKLKFICKSQGRIGFKGYSSDDLVEANEGALTLGATHLNWNGEIILDQPVYLNGKKYYESPEIMVKKDDILIVQRGSTCGKVAIVDKDYGAVTINPSLVLLKQFRENPYFFVESIKVVLNGILNEVSKTAIPMISQFQINNIQIALPPIEEQVLIVKKVQEVTAQYSEINKLILDEIIRLKEYKTTLINDAVTGKIKVA